MDSTQLIWVGGLAVHLILLAVLVQRKLLRHFPFFAALIVFYILRSLALFTLYRRISHEQYLMTFWGLALGDLLLQTTVLASLLREVFQKANFSQLRTALGGVAGILLAAILVFFWGPWPSIVTPGTDEIHPLLLMPILTSKGNLLVGILTLEAMLTMLLASQRSGLNWRSHAQRIMHGLAFYAAVNLISQALIQHLSQPSVQTSMAQVQANMNMIREIGYGRTASYFVSVAYWIGSLWIGSKTPADSLSPES